MKTNPKQITRYIFALPIVSLVLISIVMILSFILFFINFKTQGISEFKQVIISFQKEKTHDIVDSVVYEIDERIRDLNRDMKNYLKEKVYDATSIIERVIKENQKKSREELIRIVWENNFSFEVLPGANALVPSIVSSCFDTSKFIYL